MLPANVHEVPDLRDREGVFRDRTHAGEVLAELMGSAGGANAIVLAIPAGGVAVGLPIARARNLPLDLAVVSKITLPWNTEAGYGAVAFDGSVRLNEKMLAHLSLGEDQIREGIARTREKVERRLRDLRGGRPLPALRDRPVILVDDGLASGFTLLTAALALRDAGAAEVAAAVPTGHLHSILRVAPEVDALFCANVRGGRSFAVANAYENWYDVSENEVRRLLAG
jgi:predicted phosphoribosyltransferase